jgi:hypothetical protein
LRLTRASRPGLGVFRHISREMCMSLLYRRVDSQHATSQVSRFGQELQQGSSTLGSPAAGSTDAERRSSVAEVDETSESGVRHRQRRLDDDCERT